MSKLVTIGIVLGALGAGIVASPAAARSATTAEMSEACWKQAHERGGYGTDGGVDRYRDYVFNACMQNGGRAP